MVPMIPQIIRCAVWSFFLVWFIGQYWSIARLHKKESVACWSNVLVSTGDILGWTDKSRSKFIALSWWYNRIHSQMVLIINHRKVMHTDCPVNLKKLGILSNYWCSLLYIWCQLLLFCSLFMGISNTNEIQSKYMSHWR